MSLSVGDSGLDIIRREAEEAGNLIIAPTFLEVIHHVVYRDALPSISGPRPRLMICAPMLCSPVDSPAAQSQGLAALHATAITV